MRATVLVVAKAPVPGFAKTRLAAEIGDDDAAQLAAASMLDTLECVARTVSSAHRVAAITGSFDRAVRRDEISAALSSWHVVDQRGHAFADRLVAAHRDAAAIGGTAVVQIATDTPQLTPRQLRRLALILDEGYDAAVGAATDGGWWGIALRAPELAGALRDVPMSTGETCDRTVEALRALGASVAYAPDRLTDTDTWTTSLEAAVAAPRSRFAREVHRRRGAESAHAPA